MESTLFTELTVSEESNLSGGRKVKNKDVDIRDSIVGAGGGAGTGGVILGSGGDATGGDGVFVSIED